MPDSKVIVIEVIGGLVSQVRTNVAGRALRDIPAVMVVDWDNIKAGEPEDKTLTAVLKTGTILG